LIAHIYFTTYLLVFSDTDPVVASHW